MRRTFALASFALVAACGQREAPPAAGAGRAPVFDVPRSTLLAGRPIDESTREGWTVRSARGAGGGDPRHEAGAEAKDGADGASGPGKGRRILGEAEPLVTSAPAAPGAPVPGGAPPAPVPPPSAAPAEAPRFLGPGGAVAPRLRTPSDTPTPVPQAALKAGATDDNVEFAKFLTFLASWSDRPDTAASMDPLDVSERRFVAVTDAAGSPWPGAEVRVLDEARDAVVWEARTYGDGRAPFYPRAAAGLAPGAKAPPVPAGGWLVEVRAGAATKQARWDGRSETLEVRLDARRSPHEAVRLDVGFLVDTTGSMGDEIERIKTTLLEVTRRLKALGREFDLRYGAVLYRDLADDYVTMLHPFTGDVDAFSQALAVMQAGGGGDTPESLNQGLAEAVGRLAWREGAAKVLFLVADASPHMDYEGDVRYATSVKGAVAKGIRIHAVAASGLEPFGTLVFRQVAQATRGKFVFIEYGTPAQSAAGHGVTGEVQSNNLDDILFEQLQDEVARWGQAPTPAVAAGSASAR